jgi:hypothetical protein
MYNLLHQDNVRKEAFIKLNFFPKNMILHHDFNFDTHLNRGLQMNSLKSIKLLLNQILEERNTINYRDIIMLDLPELLESQKLNLDKFFIQPEKAMQNVCNIRIPLKNDEFASYSNNPEKVMLIQ